ncbi:MAG: MerC domain-containing protein [Woeseiaceae bacterium]
MNQTPAKSTDWLDGAAVGLSGLCLLHCLALPFAVGALPVLLPLAGDHLHVQMLFIVVPLSVLAIGTGFAGHRNLRVVLGAIAGLALLAIGATVAHDSLGIVADRVFSISGAIVLAIAHFYNGLLARRHRAACASS